MATLESILEDSFNEGYKNILKTGIKRTESENIEFVFKHIKYKSECIICYNENIKVIKCFQCSALYCSECLIKLASDINKCICGINFKDNYKKIIDCNLKLAQNINKPTNKPINKKNNKTNNSSGNNINYNDYDLDGLYNDNEYIINYDDFDDLNNDVINNQIGGNKTIDEKIDLIYNINENNIYNIDFNSYTNSPELNNFKYICDYKNKTITFIPYTQKYKNGKNIIVNYKYLNAYFQGTLYCHLLHIIINSPEIFIKKFNKISNAIEYFTKDRIEKKENENKINELQDKLLNEIIEISEK